MKKPAGDMAKLPKLTFVNGQFVDLTTEEGRKIADSSTAKDEDAINARCSDMERPSPEGGVRGVEVSISVCYVDIFNYVVSNC